jgi:membrane protease YdiL (CAAX protease family)
MLGDRTPTDRAKDRRESLMWMTLAAAGTLTKLGFSLISRKQFALGTVVNEFVVVSIILIALIPSAVKASHQLGLPGGPLITAKLNGEPRPYRWGEVLIAGVLWSVIALVVLMITVFAGVGLLAHFFPSLVPHFPAYQIQQGWIVKPSRSWLAAYIVTLALSAGVQEEILFRFVLMGVFSRALMTISGNADKPPSRGQLWFVNIVQAYFFGLWHLIADFHLSSGIVGLGELAIRPLAQHETLLGVFFGWLYLRHGLETSMVSHTFFDSMPLIGVPFATK